MPFTRRGKRRRICLLPTALVLLLLTLMSCRLMATQRKLSAAIAEQTALDERIALQGQENRTLEAALGRAEDPEYLQELARRNLGMVTPGQKDFYDVSH